MLNKYQKELITTGQIFLRVKVRPQSKVSGWQPELADGTAVINLKAAAVDGGANRELIKFLQKTFLTANIKIISGATGRLKLIKIWNSQ